MPLYYLEMKFRYNISRYIYIFLIDRILTEIWKNKRKVIYNKIMYISIYKCLITSTVEESDVCTYS